MIRLFELLAEKGHDDEEQHADLPLAIQFRLTALARPVRAFEVRGWTLPGGERGLEYVHPNVVRAAAEEPLIETARDQAGFDSEAFRSRLFREGRR